MRKLLSLILLGFLIPVRAQMGGSSSFAYTLIENSARHAALGGIAITNPDDDPAVGYQNPALIGPQMHGHASLSYSNYVADINHGFLSYARDMDSAGSLLFSIAYFDYGEFERTNINGEIEGVFDGSDYTFQIGYSRPWRERFRYGVNAKFLYSVYYAYVSTAGAVDVGGSYVDEQHKFTAGLLIKNMGRQFLTYSNDGNFEPLPFDVQVAVSKKLLHNPMRFTLTAYNLHKWDNSYVNVNSRSKEIDLETGEVKHQELTFGDQFMRHILFNGELVFSKNFQLRFGYNHQRRQELSPENRRAFTGFSWGFGIGVKKFYFNYGSGGLYPGISTHYFSVHRDLSSFRSRN